ncbi:MAG: hypothetical protein WBX11_02690 [Thiobacillaceae bacterium]|jgi:hypothetical protein
MGYKLPTQVTLWRYSMIPTLTTISSTLTTLTTVTSTLTTIMAPVISLIITLIAMIASPLRAIIMASARRK